MKKEKYSAQSETNTKANGIHFYHFALKIV